MFFDDQLTANGNHEQHAQPSAEKSKREDTPESELFAKAEKDQRRDSEHDPCSERFARGAGGLHDVVFKNGGATEGAKNTDGENRDGDGCGDREACAEADIHRDRTEKESEQRAENDGANCEFRQRFFGGNVRAEFAGRRGGTPGTIGHKSLQVVPLKYGVKKGARGLCRSRAAGGRASLKKAVANGSLDSGSVTG